MKALTLTSSLIAALSLTTFGQNHANLRSQISIKEKQLAEIQRELHELRSKLSAPVAGSHTVKPGETLHSIAQRHQVSVSDIMKWNKITDPTKLGIGEEIVVSGPGSSGITTVSTKERPEPLPVKSTDYIIAKGDTFYSIARRNKMTLAQLRALNPDVSTHLLSPGKKLRVSGKAPVASDTPTRKEVVVVKEAKTPKVKESSPKPPAPVTTSKETTKKPIEKVATTKNTTSEKLPEPPVIKERETSSSTKSIILTEVTTFEAFASKHGTSTKHLNALNGWNLPSSTVLASGSEILVPN
ncbi:MAG: LysM peptidoglycan-binding domain-containing protein [Akkermansiaceae bacterium]|nr:LysM peptidoglycan-binding domain-containing protein [Akkermansiaceae bacterium]